MRLLQVHLSGNKGGANSAIRYLQTGMDRIGHRCDIEMRNPIASMGRVGYDGAIFHSFTDVNREAYFEAINFA